MLQYSRGKDSGIGAKTKQKNSLIQKRTDQMKFSICFLNANTDLARHYRFEYSTNSAIYRRISSNLPPCGADLALQLPGSVLRWNPEPQKKISSYAQNAQFLVLFVF